MEPGNWLHIFIYMLITLIVLSVIGLVVLVIGLLEKDEDWMAGGIIALIVTGILGWGLGGSMIPIQTKQFNVQANVAVGKNIAFVTVNDALVYTITSAKEFDYIRGKETVNMIEMIDYNLYGVSLNISYSLPMEESPH